MLLSTIPRYTYIPALSPHYLIKNIFVSLCTEILYVSLFSIGPSRYKPSIIQQRHKMKLLPFCLICPMLIFVLAQSKNRTMHFNINVFVEVILDIRKFYSAATVVFAHPGDEYGDYGGQFELRDIF